MSNFAPVSELGGYEDERITWRLSLPDYAPSDQIGINLSRLGRLARIGGFENLRIDSYFGETTSVVPEVDSVDKHGHATASLKGSVAKANIVEAKIDNDGQEEGSYDYAWNRGNISLNLSEIDQEIGDTGKLRDASAWSTQINRGLKKGLIKATESNLLDRASTNNRLHTPFIIGCLTGYNYILGKSGNQLIASDAEGYALYLALVEPIYCRILSGDNIRERRWSLVPGFNLDRAFAVNALSRILAISKPLKN